MPATGIPPLLPHEQRARTWQAKEARRRRGEITDPDQLAAIAARVAHGELPWWVRIVSRRPAGWGRS